MYLQLFILERGKRGTIVKYNSNEHLHTETRHEQGQSAIKKGNAAYKVHLQTLNLSLANSQAQSAIGERNEWLPNGRSCSRLPRTNSHMIVRHADCVFLLPMW